MRDQNTETSQSPAAAVQQQQQQQPEAELKPSTSASTSTPEKGKWKSWWHDPNDPAAGGANWKSWVNDEDDDEDDGPYENTVHGDDSYDDNNDDYDDDNNDDNNDDYDEYSDDGRYSGHRSSVPYEGYCCRLCNVPGHWIQNCPTIEQGQIRPRSCDAAYICKVCNVGFSSESQRTAHVDQHVTCPEVDCDFAAAIEVVDEHFEKYHGFVSSKPKRKTPPHRQQSEERKYCSVCDAFSHWTQDCWKRSERMSVPPVSYVCNACGVSGHWIQRCPTRKRSAPPPSYTCRLCGVGGHWIERCPTITEQTDDAENRAGGVDDEATAVQNGDDDEPVNRAVLDPEQFEFFKRLESRGSVDGSDNAVEAAALETKVEAHGDEQPVAPSTQDEDESAPSYAGHDAATELSPGAVELSENSDAAEAADEMTLAEDGEVETVKESSSTTAEDVEVAQEPEPENDGVPTEVTDHAEENVSGASESNDDEFESSTVASSSDDGIDTEVLTAALAAAAAMTMETTSPKPREYEVPSSYRCHICHLNGHHWPRDCPQRSATAPYEGYCCKLCNVPGHWLFDCPEKQRRSQMQVKFQAKSSSPPESYVCKLCEVSGHYVRECPVLASPVPPESYVCKTCGTGGHWMKECPVMDSPVPPPSYLCKMCRVAGHWVRDCPNMDTTTPPPATYVCNNCNVAGHWIQKCPEPRKARGPSREILAKQPQQRERSESTSSSSVSATPVPESSESDSSLAAAPEEPAPVVSDLKPWRCETCETSLALESQLQAHIRQHVECPEPGCSFSAIKKHVVAHALHAHGSEAPVTTVGPRISTAGKSVDSGALGGGRARVPEVVVQGKRFSLQEVIVDGRKCIVLAEIRKAV